MGVIRHFFAINTRGSPVAVRSFLDEPSQEVVDSFYQQITSVPPPPPVFRIGKLSIAYIFSCSVYFALATEDSMAPTVLLELLSRIISVITDYIGRCTELSIQQNLAMVYEIVDEVISFGCPQTTESTSLLSLVYNTIPYETGIITDFINTEIFAGKGYARPLAIPVDQRSKTSNEVFLIIEEKLNLTFSPQGQVISSLVSGMAKVKSFLQGQPSVMLQLEPNITVASRATPHGLALTYDDMTFNNYVTTTSFDADRILTFAPPDGESSVFAYRTTRSVAPPFTMSYSFESKQAKAVVVRVSVQSSFRKEIDAEGVTIRFQCPVETSNASCELPNSVAESQKGEFDSKSRQVLWTIAKFPGTSEFSARFRFIFDDGIPAEPETLLGPIGIEFRLLGPLASGMQVKNLTVSTAGASSHPNRWYKEISVAGSYTFNFI